MFIQISGDANSGFVIECQVENISNHFEAADAPLNLEQVTSAFISYRNGTDEWRQAHTWERMVL